MTDGKETVEVLRSFVSIEFAAWMAVFMPTYLTVCLVLVALDAPIWAAVGAGLLLSKALDKPLDWITERYAARGEVTADGV